MHLDYFSEGSQLKDLETYRYELDTDKEINGISLRQMRGHVFESFKHCRDYQKWVGSSSASMLILSGYNNNRILNSSIFCWISPVAVDLINDLLGQTASGESAIYAYCVLSQRGASLYQDILPGIILQLLRKKSQVLRNDKEYGEIREELCMLQEESISPAKIDDDLRASIVEKIALRVIGLFDESDTVYIVVDRVDLCNTVRPVKTDHRYALLRVLVEMVQATRAKLRVLAVLNGMNLRVKEGQDELGITMKDRVIIYGRQQGRNVDYDDFYERREKK